MTAENEYKYIIVPLYEPADSGSRGPARATGHALIQRRNGNPPDISLYFPGEIYSGEPDLAVLAPWEDTGIALNLKQSQGNAKGLKRYTGFLPGVQGELNNKPKGQWKLRVSAREGETLLEGRFNVLDVFGTETLAAPEESGEGPPEDWLLPIQPVQPFANPLPNHLWWGIKA